MSRFPQARFVAAMQPDDVDLRTLEVSCLEADKAAVLASCEVSPRWPPLLSADVVAFSRATCHRVGALFAFGCTALALGLCDTGAVLCAAISQRPTCASKDPRIPRMLGKIPCKLTFRRIVAVYLSVSLSLCRKFCRTNWKATKAR